MKKLNIFFALIYLTLFSQAQVPTPAKENKKKILILNATAHIGNGEVIDNSVVVIENNKITMVENASNVRLDMEYYDEIIKAEGKHLYPGFIAPNSTIGLTEIDAVRATNDYRETGKYNPHVRSIIAYNTESKVAMTVRSNGVLMTQITPRGGRISGTSSIVEMDAWNWEDAAYKEDDGIHVNWPRMFKRTGSWEDPGGMSKNEKQQSEIEELNQFFIEAKAYSEIENYAEKNIRFEAMRGVFDGSKTVFVNADYVKELIQIVNFKRDLDIKNLVIIGGYDAWRITDMLKENKIAIMVRKPHELPVHPEDDVDLPYKLPYLLEKAGVDYCLQNAGDMEVMNARNLPFLAGTAAAYGLSKEQALAAITSKTAKILGIYNKVGSIEVNKEATLIISSGDALDMRTNNIEYAFIQGKSIDLNNHQIDLYKRYSEKYKN